MDNLLQLLIPDSKITEIEFIKNGCFYDKMASFHADMPNFCRVAVHSTPGKTSLILTELWIPENWNGVFLGLGNGGMAGTINYHALAHYVRQGYAAAQTDLGTSRGRNSGINNLDIWKDFGWCATHIMTCVSKTILKAHYAREARYAYFIGSSTGGQQAFSEAQRFPEDYDGILAGVPANNRVCLHTYFLWNHIHLRTRDGKVMFTAEEVHAITDCAVKFFQLRGDGVKGDDFITFPYLQESTIEDFLDFLHQTHPTFREEQLEALRAVYTGPVNPVTGAQIYNGMPIGSEIYGCGILDCQAEESPHFYPFIWAFGENYNGYDFDFAGDLDKLSKVLSENLNANDENLTAFHERGGKILAYSGSADPCVPFPDAMKYYNRVCEKMGGYDNVKSFFQYFILPGKDHGEGGKGANVIWNDEKEKKDLLVSLRNWREYGMEPGYIIAARCLSKHNQENAEFIRKVYPYKADKKEGRDFSRACDIRYLTDK